MPFALKKKLKSKTSVCKSSDKRPLVAEESPGEDGKAIGVEAESISRWEPVPLALVEGVRLANSVAAHCVVMLDAEAELAGLHVLQPVELDPLRSVPVPVNGCLVPGVVICSKHKGKVMKIVATLLTKTIVLYTLNHIYLFMKSLIR